MKRTIAVAAAAFLVGCLSVLAWVYFSRNGTESTTRIFGDWKQSCLSPSVATPNCSLTQAIRQSGSGATLADLQVVQGGDPPQFLIVVPNGVQLKSGLKLSIGNSAQMVLRYRTCNSIGCIAAMPLDAAALETLEGSDAGHIEVVWKDGNSIGIPFSLKGFPQGIAEFRWESFKRDYGMERLLP